MFKLLSREPHTAVPVLITCVDVTSVPNGLSAVATQFSACRCDWLEGRSPAKLWLPLKSSKGVRIAAVPEINSSSISIWVIFRPRTPGAAAMEASPKVSAGELRERKPPTPPSPKFGADIANARDTSKAIAPICVKPHTAMEEVTPLGIHIELQCVKAVKDEAIKASKVPQTRWHSIRCADR
mmetsp:Transcript_29842/g.49421  ORF Transcript_29842/g.49421 Transcript_29842/m.49421 type:complete len:182 (-) Transcript_29842:493-1038(-)|eukprot:CAMPEP_0119304910 /NCGR_PEP_ID=MMETSP1333-20130426/6025_1 /TAXON_ID=418940 /ORGANISM="Scyphosphaera apsteinii, Strain RCC1455" /LENGTH=181 /DNA_ID=CAMNT_0007307875 /DNA_START=264 /DNA_END=809 /DNA_ORIENTATION=-